MDKECDIKSGSFSVFIYWYLFGFGYFSTWPLFKGKYSGKEKIFSFTNQFETPLSLLSILSLLC